MKVLIVGGVAGGASCAARLRRLDESAEIIMFERGEYISYANCGLPYYIGERKIKGNPTLYCRHLRVSKKIQCGCKILNEVVSNQQRR